jgi:16S rRNA (uracil1498-N3)-methyltransferase
MSRQTHVPGSKPAARLHVTADLAQARSVALDPGQAHHLRDVLRLAPGAGVTLFNGRDGEWRGTLQELAKKGGAVRAEEQVRMQEAGSDLWLVFAPLKSDRLDFLVEKASELGVSALAPTFTRHTAVGRINRERMQARAIEAAEQCERLTVPEVLPAVTLDERLYAWPRERKLFACVEAGPAQPIAEALAAFAGVAGGAQQPCAVLSGPEGGFAAAELDALRKLPFVTPVGLGPRVLRAETAALAALACFQAILGDGTVRPPMRA